MERFTVTKEKIERLAHVVEVLKLDIGLFLHNYQNLREMLISQRV